MTLKHPKAPAESIPDLPLAPHPDMPSEPSTGVEGGEPGRIKRATAWGKRSATKAGEVADRERQRHVSVDVGFRTAERQRRVAAMVLAGGIAYRIFFWTLAVSVVVGGVLGFFDPDAVQSTLEHHGVAGWEAAAVASLTRSSDGNEWWLLLVGSYLVLWTGYTCSKALALAHATIWGVAPPRLEQAAPRLAALQRLHGRLHRCDGSCPVCPGAEPDRRARGDDARPRSRVRASGCSPRTACRTPPRAGSSSCPGRSSSRSGSRRCTSSPSTSSGPKLESATQLYGLVGIVTTMLFWFYLGGRLIVAGGDAQRRVHRDARGEARHGRGQSCAGLNAGEW